MPRFGGRGRRKKSEYVRATSLFKVDAEYLPKGAKWALRGRVEGEYLDAVAEVMEKGADQGALVFSVVMWRGDENPVLSIGPSEPRERTGRGRRKGADRPRRRQRDEEDMDREEEPEDRGIEDPGADEDDADEGGPDTDGLDLD